MYFLKLYKLNMILTTYMYAMVEKNLLRTIHFTEGLNCM